MFRRASEEYHLSAETWKLLHENDGGGSPRFTPDKDLLSDAAHKLNSQSVMTHAREVWRQIRKQWKDFDPGPEKLVTKHFYDVAQDDWIPEQVMVQIDKTPFGRGALRECFRMKEVRVETREIAGEDVPAESPVRHDSAEAAVSGEESPRDHSPRSPRVGLATVAKGLIEMRHDERRMIWVAKRSIADHGDLEAHRHSCRVDVVSQSVAKHCAELFNQEVQRRAKDTGLGRCGAHDVDFLLTHVVEMDDGSTYGAEAFVFGHYEKHSNNSGGTMGCRNTPQSFSYFTWRQSGHRHMVVDVQGVGDIYTDPAIHFLPSHVSNSLKSTDSPVNLGLRGFALFLWSHRYNAIDKLLELPEFALSPAERAHKPVMATNQKIKDMASTGATIAACRSEVSTAASERTTSSESFEVGLGDVPGVDLEWAMQPPCDAPSAPRPTFGRGQALQLELVEAACHMEIATMYNDGRICLGAPGSGPQRVDIQSALFHLVEAARLGLAEALLALARLASDMPHEEFLPHVVGQEKHKPLCLDLLARAGALGAFDAHGAAARLILDGGYSGEGQQALLVASRHLEAYVEGASAAANAPIPEQELESHDLHCQHGCTFGWEGHGWAVHAALARAAELYEAELSEEPGSRAKARGLWEYAAEIALEDPCLAKQAMRYSERAANLEDDDEEEEPQDA